MFRAFFRHCRQVNFDAENIITIGLATAVATVTYFVTRLSRKSPLWMIVFESGQSTMTRIVDVGMKCTLAPFFARMI